MTAEQRIELEFVEGSRFFLVPGEFWFKDSRTNFWYVFKNGSWVLERLNLGNMSSYWEVQEEELSFEDAQLRFPDHFPMITTRNARLEKKILGDLKFQRELETDDQKFEDPTGLPLGYLWHGEEESSGRQFSHQVKDAGYPNGAVAFGTGRSFLGKVTYQKRYFCIIEPTGVSDHQLTIFGPSFPDKNEAQTWVVQKLNELCK